MQNNKDALITVAQFEHLLDTEHPFAKILGIEIVDIGHGTSELFLPANPSYTRLGGVIAGPMIMALADMALYAAAISATGEPRLVTASLTINFVRGAPPGGIRAKANVIKTGRLISAEVFMYPENDDTVLSHAISTWAVPRQTNHNA